LFFFSSRRRHTRWPRDWSSDVCSSDLFEQAGATVEPVQPFMTRAMIDGMDDFWRMRAWLDIAALDESRRARVLPFIVAWAQRGQIGRASCRESVGRSVVGGALKKRGEE